MNVGPGEVEQGGESMCPPSEATVQLAREPAASTLWLEGGGECCPPMRSLADGQTVVLGGAPGVDMRLLDSTVSGRHCVVTMCGGQLIVEDLKSTNGLYVGGARVERAYLRPGGSFVIGRAVVACTERPLARSSETRPLSIPGVVGQSSSMQRVIAEVRRLAAVKGSVLLRGETGSGKDVLARALHDLGGRRGSPFVPLNVGTLPRELADAELFGHERGAFTGAHGTRDGAFVQAHGGTLFLDEIAELPLDLQVKLLRVLEDGEVRPLGGRRRKVDVRVVSATWAPLHVRVAEGLFRQDLYQRLAVFVVDVPPLRERRSDLSPLAARFLADLEPEVGPRELSSGALAKLSAYSWPGNVRELRNVLYRAALHSPGRLIGGREIADSLDVAAAPQRLSISPLHARAAVDSHGGNISAAARQLGVARSTFRGLLQR